MKRITHRLCAILMVLSFITVLLPTDVFAASQPTPSKVTLTKISAPAYNKITVNWKKASNVTSYVIYYKVAGTSKWTRLATTSSGKTGYTHTASKKHPITVGKKYSYTVRGYHSKSQKYGSYNTKGLTTNTIPNTVKLTKASLDSNKTSVTVSWNKAAGASHYVVYRKTGSSAWKRLATLSASTTRYTDKSPVKGKTNIYTVRSYYSKTKSYGKYNSKGVSATVPKAASSQVTPSKVTLSKISAPAYNKITVNWKKASNVTSYVIYYKVAGASKWTRLATTSSDKTGYTHTASSKYPITVGQKYSYTVRGYHSTSKKYGSYNTKGLTTNTIPNTVKLTKASLNSSKTSVTVSWNKAAGASHHMVYRKVDSSGWKHLATLSASTTSYTDKSPVKGKTNIYMARGYYSKTKSYGKYDSKGVSATVPKPAHQHSYKGEVQTPPTYQDTGTMIYSCSCGREYSESIPVLKHFPHTWEDLDDLLMNWGSLPPDDAGHHSNVQEITSITICANCGEFFGDKDHWEDRYMMHTIFDEDSTCQAYTVVKVSAIHRLFSCTQCLAYKRGELMYYQYPAWPGGGQGAIVPTVYQKLTPSQIEEMGLSQVE